MNSLARLGLVPLTLLLVACPAEDTGKEDSDPGENLDKETGYVEDTGETGDTGESAVIPDDTGDSAPIDTGDSGQVEPGLAGLIAFPRAMVVNPGATYTLDVLAEEMSGDRHPYDMASFVSLDDTIATVDAMGVVTAVAVGSTAIVVSGDGVDTRVQIEVRDDYLATVTVIEGSTGLPIEGATVRAATGDFTTDASGIAYVTVADGGPVMLTTWIDEDHHAVSLANTVGRVFTIPLDALSDDEPSATIHGNVDFTDVPEADAGQMVMGLACASVQGALALLDIEDLLADTRTIEVFGVEADAPSNLFAKDYAEDFYAPAFPGDAGAWGLSGPIDIGEVTAGLNGTGDALALLVDHLDDMVWGKRLGLATVADATTETDFAPADAFSDVLNVALPTLPMGFDGTEEMFLMSAERAVPEGWLVTGLGMGSGVAEVQRVPSGSVPGSVQNAVFAFAQAGGLGSGGGVSVAVTGDDGGLAAFPDLLDLPVVDSWDAGSRALTITTDADADIVRVRLVDDNGRLHDIYVEGSWSGTLDKAQPEFERGKADVQVDVYGGIEGNFEHWLSTSTFEPDNHEPETRARYTLVKE
ncbi:MAG: Ig-like domain-containing protein [Deltaproteobacteria bacterium]|nr:Ig-like domain-containing protein [Deltaproteobacteria bacterium]